MKKFCIALQFIVAFLLCWFSLWLYLIIFCGGSIGLLFLMFAIEKRENKNG